MAGKLPCLISVALHISAGIRTEEELTHFFGILPTSVHSKCLNPLMHRTESGTVSLMCLDWFKYSTSVRILINKSKSQAQLVHMAFFLLRGWQ